MEQVYLMRHCSTLANEKNVRCGGDWDLGLTSDGRMHAQRIGSLLEGLSPIPTRIFGSKLRRVSQTIGILRQSVALPLFEVEDLRERGLGEWNGRSVAETEPRLQAGEIPPGGEDAESFSQRVLRGFASVLASEGDVPLIVASRGVARVMGERYLVSKTLTLRNGEVALLDLGSGTIHRMHYMPPPHRHSGQGGKPAIQ